MTDYLNRKISYERLTYPQVGFIKRVEDPKSSGRLWVWIPAFETQEDDETGWILCTYCSPFAGTTNRDDLSKTNYDEFERTQTSYGIWAIPPDINNEVLVMFPNGDIAKAIWIGGLYKEYMNSSVPGQNISTQNKNVRGKPLPVAEYNKYDKVSGDAANPMNPVRPWNLTKAEGIGNQGLISDKIRGIINHSSHKTKAPSIFGWSSPGPLTADGKGRLTGSSFVMDDDPDNEHICFTTRSGAKLILSETHGFVYLMNRRGTGWIQIDDDGNIDFFAAGDISMRTRKSFNLRADKDINIEAGNNIHVKAAKDTDAEGSYVGALSGVGGDIRIEAMNDYHTAIEVNQYHLVRTGNVDYKVALGNSTGFVKGDCGMKVLGDSQVTVFGNHHMLVAGENLLQANTSHTRIDGQMVLGVSGQISLSSSNFSVSQSGDVISSNFYGSDFKTPSHSLNNHQHRYNPGPGPLTLTSSAGGGGGESSFTATPNNPDAANDALSAIIKDAIGKTDILESFPTTTATSYGGKTIEIPDWWTRDKISVDTIVDRLPTFEPCPEHRNTGI